ncbi:hypothetical protein QAD02_010798 [Eretmocerus hayati]|uniref:Uncharacterized protein n=1 Tax=Eretmocerus hayati TaxID=131215 RepID=A0ACC2NXS8_9HYME|nr:hypothetical protein QAD02_010798 [Eretmocerus hayati]
MASIARASIICILVWLSYDLTMALDVIISEQRNFINTRLIMDPDSIENMTVSYALCDQDRNGYRRDCSIILETISLEGVVYADRCDTRFETSQENSWISPEMRVSPFGSSKAIVRWIEITKSHQVLIKFRTINFPECTWTEAHINDYITFNADKALDRTNLLIYENKFDVVFRNSTSCFRRRCKISFNGDGGKMAPARPWLKVGPLENFDVKAIAVKSPEQGFFVTMSDLTGTNVTVVYDEGIPKDYATFSIHHERVVSSTANGILVFCAISTKNPYVALCKQFSRFGNVKLQTEVSIGYDLRELAVYNLNRGGILLLTGSTRGGDSYYVTKIGMEAQRFRSVQVTEFKCDKARVVKPNFFEIESGHVCVSLLCIMDNSFSLVVKCFTDKVLSVKYWPDNEL